MPTLTLHRRETPPHPPEVVWSGPPGPAGEGALFWAAACVAASGMRLVTAEDPDDGPAPGRARFRLHACPGGAEEAAVVELQAGGGPEGVRGGSALSPVRLVLPRDGDRLVDLLLGCGDEAPPGVGVVLCRTPGAAQDRPGLAWSVARLLCLPGEGIAVDARELTGHRGDGRGPGPGVLRRASVAQAAPRRSGVACLDAAVGRELLGVPLDEGCLAELLASPGSGAVVVDVGQDRSCAERLVSGSVLGVMVGDGPPGAGRAQERPGWVTVTVPGRLGQGTGPEQWRRALRGRAVQDLGARLQLAAEGRAVAGSGRP